jgi:hypothetical protein
MKRQNLLNYTESQKQELLLELKRIIEDYVTDDKTRNHLINTLTRENVKGILAEINKNRTFDFADRDISIIQDAYFYFC